MKHLAARRRQCRPADGHARPLLIGVVPSFGRMSPFDDFDPNVALASWSIRDGRDTRSAGLAGRQGWWPQVGPKPRRRGPLVIVMATDRRFPLGPLGSRQCVHRARPLRAVPSLRRAPSCRAAGLVATLGSWARARTVIDTGATRPRRLTHRASGRRCPAASLPLSLVGTIHRGRVVYLRPSGGEPHPWHTGSPMNASPVRPA